jgi:DNA gyrase subunit A
VTAEEELMIITDGGVVIRQEVTGISLIGRNTQGVTIMKTNDSSAVVALAKFVSRDEE